MIINGARRRRIAKGSGTSVQEVNTLLKQYAQARKMMKTFLRRTARRWARSCRTWAISSCRRYVRRPVQRRFN